MSSSGKNTWLWMIMIAWPKAPVKVVAAGLIPLAVVNTSGRNEPSSTNQTFLHSYIYMHSQTHVTCSQYVKGCWHRNWKVNWRLGHQEMTPGKHSRRSLLQRCSKCGKGIGNLNYCQHFMYTRCHSRWHHARCTPNWVNGGRLPYAWVCYQPLAWFSDLRAVQRSVSNVSLFGHDNGGGCGGGDWPCDEVVYEGTVFFSL